jgi:hypothetical protein
LKLIEDPFSVDPEEVPLLLQLEFIELQFSTVLEISTEKAACETSTKVWIVKSTKILAKLR